MVCWQNLEKGVPFQYLTLVLVLQNMAYVNKALKWGVRITWWLRPLNNQFNSTWRRRINICTITICSHEFETKRLFPSRDEARADWEVSEEFRGPARLRCHRSQSPGSDKLDRDRGEGELGPKLLPIFHQNGHPNIPNIGHKSSECLKLLNSKGAVLSLCDIINQFNSFDDVMRLLDVCLLLVTSNVW